MDTYAVPPTAYHYRDAPRRSAWLARFLWLDIVVSAVYGVACAAGVFVPAAARIAGQLLMPVSAVIVATLLLFFFWLYRAAMNVRALGADVSFEPPGAVGWFITPVVSLWMAFVVVEEIWRASLDAADWRDQHAPWLVIYWWSAWVVASLGGTLLYFSHGNIVVKLVYLAGHIAHCYLLIPIVERIRELQQAQAAHNGLA